MSTATPRNDRRQWLPGLLDKPAPPVVPTGEPGPACLACGGATVISPGVGPHHAKITCTRCPVWRWQPKPRPVSRGGPAS